MGSLKRKEELPGASWKRERGGGQSQMQGGQEVLELRRVMPFLNLQ